MKLSLAVLLAATMLSAPAIAQTNSPNAAPAGAASTAAAPAAMKTTASEGWRASKLIGVDVYNAQNESIGEINEVILDRSGKVTGYVIGVGGFLGMGQHDVLLPMDQVKFVNEPRAMPATAARPVGTAPAGTTAAPAATTGVAPAAGTRPADNRTAAAATRSKDEMWYPDHAIVNATKDQLKNMQAFKYN